MTFERPGTPAHDLQNTVQQSLNDLVDVKQWLAAHFQRRKERYGVPDPVP